MKLYDTEPLYDRARDLETTGHNGIERVLVTLNTTSDRAYASLAVEFYNDRSLSAILDKVNNQGVPPTDIFRIRGGSRIIAGNYAGQVQVEEAAPGTGDHILQLKVQPIGDYSTYTLKVVFMDVVLDENNNPVLENKIDPLFASIDFKFRPGCFNTNCAPISKYEAPSQEPVIDYLAKDFDSFKHVLINAMLERVPNWQPTSEADLDQVLIDLIAADADELSDYQDRVMNEAYFGRVRKRVSLARHARLMDYHIHQGNQANTWIAVKMKSDDQIPKDFGVWTGKDWQYSNAVLFKSIYDQECFKDLNELALYSWGGVVTALETGSTEADIVSPDGTTKSNAEDLRDLLRRDDVTALVIEEKLNPESGTKRGRDKTGRQLLRLLEDDAAAELVNDPVNNVWAVRVRWQEEDKLKHRYCFVIQCPGKPSREGVSAFHGNLIKVTQGRPHIVTFHPVGNSLGPGDNSKFVRTDEACYERTSWGTLCRLPHPLLAYMNTKPGGEKPTRSTFMVEVSGFADHWEEQSDLIESKSDDTHFIVETDEFDMSTVRFGDNVNGRALPQDAVVTCRYQVGRGSLGNVGADSLTGFDNSPTGFPHVEKVWNPLDVTDGQYPEKPSEVVRRATQAYKARQLRAVTLEDYTRRAEELPGVSHAYARYSWTGSWRTVRVAIDPKGTTKLSDELREKIVNHLDAVRLIGEDLEVRCARYVALDIMLRLCAHPDYWPEDLAHELELEFSDGYTVDGRKGFFYQDSWTFGQYLHASQLIGRALAVKGMERMLLVSMRRWNPGSGERAPTIIINSEDLPVAEIVTLKVEPYEVIQVANDPSHLEYGRIEFDIQGGRQ